MLSGQMADAVDRLMPEHCHIGRVLVEKGPQGAPGMAIFLATIATVKAVAGGGGPKKGGGRRPSPDPLARVTGEASTRSLLVTAPGFPGAPDK